MADTLSTTEDVQRVHFHEGEVEIKKLQNGVFAAYDPDPEAVFVVGHGFHPFTALVDFVERLRKQKEYDESHGGYGLQS